MQDDSIILAAVAIAKEAHKHAKRKYSDRPYIFHPLRVMGRVAIRPGAGSLEVSAAVLHDTHEDPPYIPLERIERHIHPQVAVYVGNLTSPSKRLAGPDGRYPKQWNRAKRVALNCEHIHKCDFWTQTIKCDDRIDNLEELMADLHGWAGRPDKDFVEMYCDESVQYVRAMDKITQEQRDELERTISLLRSAAATAY